jgi:hypothetical protein
MERVSYLTQIPTKSIARGFAWFQLHELAAPARDRVRSNGHAAGALRI